jgi:hypothetical protein
VRFRVDKSVWPWLQILDPEAVRAELEAELTRPELLAALAAGPPAGVGWESFRFVLLAIEQALELEAHGLQRADCIGPRTVLCSPGTVGGT